MLGGHSVAVACCGTEEVVDVNFCLTEETVSEPLFGFYTWLVGKVAVSPTTCKGNEVFELDRCMFLLQHAEATNLDPDFLLLLGNLSVEKRQIYVQVFAATVVVTRLKWNALLQLLFTGRCRSMIEKRLSVIKLQEPTSLSYLTSGNCYSEFQVRLSLLYSFFFFCLDIIDWRENVYLLLQKTFIVDVCLFLDNVCLILN